MIETEDWMNIQVLAKQGLSYAEIARLVERDWRTVKRAVATDIPPRYQRAPRGSKLDPYRRYLDAALARGILRATRLFRELRTQGYPGSYELVKVYVRQCKRTQRQHATGLASRPRGPVQDPMGVREAAFGRQAHHAQSGRHGACPGSQYRP